MNELSSIIILIWLIPVTVFILIPLSAMCVHLVFSVFSPLVHRVNAENVDLFARKEVKAA